MTWLIVGLIVFLGVHSVRAVAPAWRDAMVARLGEGSWKGLYSLISLAGLVLLVWGYAQARPDAPVFYESPIWTRHIVIVLMWIAMVLLVAAYVPTGHIKKRIKHPMITAVKVWALAHLLANGDLATIVLCLAVLGWAVFVRIAEKRGGDPVFESVSVTGDIIAVVAGSVVTLWFVLQLHELLIGVSPV
ncbi:NnrU family protein [Oricola sp.]|uniref:NnrU family protein n=1 Tax=Oricola sp. TaxID=1979950 RepID=UPI003517B5BC